MWFLPSSHRIQQLQAMINQMVETGLSTPGRIIVNYEELEKHIAEYDALQMPSDWDVIGTHAEGMAEKVQEAYINGVCKDADWIGVLCDDHWPITENWDTKLIEGLQGWNAVTSDDCHQVPKRMEGATVWSRGLIDAIGYLAPSNLRHLYFDDCWERLGATTGCLQWRMDIKVAHRPATYTHREDATAKNIHNFRETDEVRFRVWIKDEFPAACQAVLDCAAQHGAKVERPDLTGVSIYLATPSGAGQFDRRYVRSLLQTVEIVRAAGGHIDWAEMPYCADLSYARNRIFGAFMRSLHTHLLMIDDDMGWQPHDVLRLIRTGLDFVGGAGPKKNYPLRFCVLGRDEFGREVPSPYHESTGTLEVAGIGTGFLMVSRSCAERMAVAHPELQFDPGEGQTEYGLFDPLILNRVRYSDDFAFCHRWRALGGKIHVLPTVKLAHIGSHCFEGSLMDAMAAEPHEAGEAA